MKHFSTTMVRAAAEKTILVVHEDKAVRLVIRAVLQGAGYRVLLHSGFGDRDTNPAIDLAIAGGRFSRKDLAIPTGVRVMPLPVRIEDGIIRVECGFLEEVRRLTMDEAAVAAPLERMPPRVAMGAAG